MYIQCALKTYNVIINNHIGLKLTVSEERKVWLLLKFTSFLLFFLRPLYTLNGTTLQNKLLIVHFHGYGL
jgi:hypothetical protein